ncbi:MAG: hypothetical protein ACK56F_32620, partial [bacterium]
MCSQKWWLVRMEIQFQYRYETNKREEAAKLFTGELDSKAVVERLREVLTKDNAPKSTSSIEGRTIEAAHAMATYIRNQAEIKPQQGGKLKNILVPLREILEQKLPGDYKLHFEILEDRKLAKDAEAY